MKAFKLVQKTENELKPPIIIEISKPLPKVIKLKPRLFKPK
jgi:hypothetical protein